MAKLRIKAKQDQRIEYQVACVRAILEGTNLGTHCFLAKVKDEQPYDDLALPVNLGELEFTLKGALRCEMIDQDETSYARWRRLFGTTKRRQFPKGVKGGQDLPTSWRSRVYVRAFQDADSARQALDGCPLAQWEGLVTCPLTAKAAEADRSRMALLQIHDVQIEDGTFAELLA